jgi:hypothetical protein
MTHLHLHGTNIERAAASWFRPLPNYRCLPGNFPKMPHGCRRKHGAPFERGTGEIKRLSFERQAEIVLMQMQKCLEAAGSSLAKVLKCNVYCTPEPAHFAMFNDIYARYFPRESPARIFLHVPSFTGPRYRS